MGLGAHGRTRGGALHHWHPVDVLHFPFRSLEQWERKGVRRARGDKPLGQYVSALLASESGRARDRYQSLVVDDEALERGLAQGSLVRDTRLRDAIRETSTRTAARAPTPARSPRRPASATRMSCGFIAIWTDARPDRCAGGRADANG